MSVPLRIMVLAICSGFLGGLAAAWLLLEHPAVASQAALNLPRIITAEEFRLAAVDGSIRATFGLLPDGQPALSFADRSRCIRINLLLRSDDHPHLAFLNAAGQTMVSVSSLEDGRAVLAFQQKDGHKLVFPDDLRPFAQPVKP